MSQDPATGDAKRPLPISTKLGYGFGDLGFSITNTIIALFFSMFLTDVVGVRAKYAAIAVFLGRTWDYFNDPFVGYLSDRTRSRWGRRRPWLLFGAPPYALAFAMMWWKPPIASPIGLAAYYAVAYVLFDTATTALSTPYYALTPEITDDYDERTSLVSYRMAFSIAGSLIAFTTPLMIIGSMRPENSGRVFLMGIVYGVVAAAPMWVVFAKVRERPGHVDEEPPSLKESLKAAWKNAPFRFSATIYLLTWVSIDIVLASLLYFLKYRMNLESKSDLVSGTIFVVAFLSLPAWEWISRRWDKRVAFLVGISFWAVIQIVLVMIAPSWGLTAALVCAALGGVGVGAAHVLPWALIPDAVEWDEYHSGRRHEGMFYALVSLAQKVASSLAVPGALLILDATGYVPNSPTQSASAINGIRLLFGPTPAVLLVLALVCAWRYPLSREEHARIRAALEARKNAEREAAPTAP
ncbi:MAG: MFS transporter [Myxococcales bacterium]|nr:MFS transporter [Myxococcales bacterium]